MKKSTELIESLLEGVVTFVFDATAAAKKSDSFYKDIRALAKEGKLGPYGDKELYDVEYGRCWLTTQPDKLSSILQQVGVPFKKVDSDISIKSYAQRHK